MGINTETAEFLCESRAAGASFQRVLTLGRLNLNVSRAALRSLAKRFGVDASAADDSAQDYSEGFLRHFLGAESIEAVDHSAYEGAAITHDLNKPVRAEWERRYDAIIDGGTLEHVFNFPVAIANCMRLAKEGGRLFIFTPANNQLGHGFYQFSPELFYRTLDPAHGFEVEAMLAVQSRFASTECGSIGSRFSVADPASVGSRITLVNSRPVTLMIRARKVAHLDDPLAISPQQSDYGEVWDAGDGNAVAPQRTQGLSALLKRPARLARRLMPGVEERLRNEYDRRYVHSFHNKAFYTRAKR